MCFLTRPSNFEAWRGMNGRLKSVQCVQITTVWLVRGSAGRFDGFDLGWGGGWSFGKEIPMTCRRLWDFCVHIVAMTSSLHIFFPLPPPVLPLLGEQEDTVSPSAADDL